MIRVLALLLLRALSGRRSRPEAMAAAGGWTVHERFGTPVSAYAGVGGGPAQPSGLRGDEPGHGRGETWSGPGPEPEPWADPEVWPEPGAGPAPEVITGPRAGAPPRTLPIRPGPGTPPRRRRVPRRLTLAVLAAAAGLIFRKALASVVLTALSVSLHFLGLNVHLPHIRFAWPWQTVTSGTTTNAEVGPWVLQKIEGISKPALGSENFTFVFTHKVSKNIGPWPCWYSSTFYADGHASATVNLNPGPAWWKPATGHYRLQVLARPAGGRPGRVAVSMVLPAPQLPQNVHDVSIDNTLSKPLTTQHSWTYPGLGCGALIKPQFSESVLYAQAQTIAFDRVKNVSSVTKPLISAAETQAQQIIRNNFVQPTLNAFGYSLASFSIRWASSS